MENGSTRLLSIDDEKWKDARITLYSVKEVDVIKPADTHPQGFSDMSCFICEVAIFSGQTDFRAHFKSDWHKYNLIRSNQGRSTVSEDEYKQMVSDNEETRSLESASDLDLPTLSRGSREHFICEGFVYSMYRCILQKDEAISNEIFKRPLNCAIFLLSGGRFCGGVFCSNELILHKSLHRYVVRAKQGSSQSAADSKHKAQSAGATLRRYSEIALKDDVRNLIESWHDDLQNVPLVFIKCATLQRSVFIADEKKAPFSKLDERIRCVPFVTRKPTVIELRRTWMKLKEVYCHGTVEEFEEKRKQSVAKLKQKKCLLPRRVVCSEGDSSDSSLTEHSSTDSEPSSATNENTIVQLESNEPEREALSVDTKNHDIYSAIRLSSFDRLKVIVSGDRTVVEYMKAVRYPPNSSTLLHIAARRSAAEIIRELLLIGCDPSNKDADAKVPYQVAQNREIRQAFSKFRAEYPDMYDWKRSQVPELAVLSEEKLAKEAERKRVQKEKRKLRLKLKKEEQRQQKAEKTERETFLALSDREKRALAAERRLASSLQTRCVIVSIDGNRCFKCGDILTTTPFEYSANRFCSLPCLQQHRREYAEEARPSTS